MKINTDNHHACAKARTDCPHVCSEVVLSPVVHNALCGCVHNSSGCVSSHNTQAFFSPAHVPNTDTLQIYAVVCRQARNQVAVDHMYMWRTSMKGRMEIRCNPTPQYSQGRSAVAWLPRRLCYRPTVFFCHIPLPALSFESWKFQHNFHKFYLISFFYFP